MADRFAPDPGLSRDEMEELQREIASAAVFADDGCPTPEAVRLGDALVAGVDQAFLAGEPERALSAIVVLRRGQVVERATAVVPLSIPYIPGLLSFREGESILAAFEELEADPDLVLFDGSGRIHFRQAGIATHVGVLRDVPSVGVAKSLLCGTPRSSVDGLPQGARVAIEADDRVERVASAADGEPVERADDGDGGDDPASDADGTVLGYAYQSRQYANSRTINPLYVSPGHRVDAETAVDLVAACGGEYKLPEPTRLADRYADEAKREL